METALSQHAPPQIKEDPSLHELPPLVVDGIPTPVEKMTQAQLRAFIPLMLKYSTGRGKPGWGKESTRPQWWPQDLPWANVRSDARNEEDKQKVSQSGTHSLSQPIQSVRLTTYSSISFPKQVSWTHALRQIVINCYKFHGREDLLPAFTEDEDKNSAGTSSQNKEKVKNRNATQHHSSINVTNLTANTNITTVPISADASVSLAAQGVNVCPVILGQPRELRFHFCFVIATRLSCFVSHHHPPLSLILSMMLL